MIATANHHIKLEEIAAGRELEILEQVAGIPHEYLNKKGHPCPLCGGKDRFSLIDEARGTVFCRHCFNHGNRGYVNAVIHYGQASDYKEARKMILEHLNNTGTPSTQSQSTQPTPSTQKTRLVQTGMWIYKDENKDHVKKVARWSSYDNQDKQIYQYIRYNNKWVTKTSFSGSEAEWTELYDYASSIPLNLPTILENKDDTVFIVEGEKCCVILAKWERCATTGSGGVNTAANWGKYLTGRDVVILPDNDEPGYKYALKTAQSLQGKAQKIRVVFLPDLQEKEDIYDWIKKGNTKKQFSDIVAKTPTWDGKPFAYKNKINNDETEQEAVKKIGSYIQYKNFEEIPEEKVEYLLQDIIPLSAVTLFVGFAGDGKSYLSTWLSAMVSKEGNYFRNQPIPAGKAFICNAEDNAANTILPRLHSNEANIKNVANIDSVQRTIRTKNGTTETYQDMITLSDVDLVKKMCEENPTCKVIVFDPLSAFWGEYNENKGSDVRIILSKYKKLAETYKIAVVLVTHYNKGYSTEALARISGSNAIPASCRAVWSVTNDLESDLRFVTCIKNNLSENRDGFTFEIIDGKIEVQNEFIDMTADEALQERISGQQNQKRGPKGNKLGECCNWLRGMLANGPIQSTLIFEKAAEAGYSERTVKTAKKNENIQSQRVQFSGISMWSISPFSQECKIYPPGNFALFEQTLQNKEETMNLNQENSQECKISPIYTNFALLGENAPKNTNSTVETNCENNSNNETKIPADSTVTKDCGKTKKSPESSDMVVTTTVEEAQERVTQIIESKQERLKRINQQKEENLKKMNKNNAISQ